MIGLHIKGEKVVLNPPMNTVISQADLVIAVSEDDDTVVASENGSPDIRGEAISHNANEQSFPRKIIILGWNWRAPIVIRELANYLSSGSTLMLVADSSLCSPELPIELENIDVQFTPGNTTDRSMLESLSLEQYDHIILLSYSDALDVQSADSSTLMTLLHIRDLADKLGQRFSLISEMRDVRNRNLAEITGADDYIVSDQLLSLLLTQISENKDLSQLFWDLFDPEGSEIYLKPVERFISCESPVNFYTVVKSASELNEIAFGYRLDSHRTDPAESYGVVVNPKKSDMIQFSRNDKIIVLAED